GVAELLFPFGVLDRFLLGVRGAGDDEVVAGEALVAVLLHQDEDVVGGDDDSADFPEVNAVGDDEDEADEEQASDGAPGSPGRGVGAGRGGEGCAASSAAASAGWAGLFLKTLDPFVEVEAAHG